MKTKVKSKVKNKFIPLEAARARSALLPLTGLKSNFLDLLAKIASDKNLLDKFFGCILSPKEYQEIIIRLQIFKMIREGYTQRQIRDQLKIGLATVSRGAREVKEQEIVLRKIFSAKGGSASGGKKLFKYAQKIAKNKN